MNACPYANGSTTCDLPSIEVEAAGAPTIAYCQQCAQIAFRCISGHWNRAFARYCTQCSQQLEKPAAWRMASANPQRTATLPQTPAVDALNYDCGFGSWVISTPEIETAGNLPELLAIDGLIVVPNPRDRRLDAYTIAKSLAQQPEEEDEPGVSDPYATAKSLARGSPILKWSIALNEELTYASTPIYHELHLFFVVSGGIQRGSVFGGETQHVNIEGIDAAQIEPIPACPPLKCDVGGRPAMVAGLKQGVLLFDCIHSDSPTIKAQILQRKQGDVTGPVQCGRYIVFTSREGGILSLNVGASPYKVRWQTFEGISFSAPVSLGDAVYFEALKDSGERSLACYAPGADKLWKAAKLDTEPTHNLEARRSLFIHPPLTDGRQLFLSDRYGQVVYIYDSDIGLLPKKKLPENDGKHRFIPHQSIVVQNRIYSAHSSGLTVIELPPNSNVQYRSLAMGLPTVPSPINRPIRYGDKLFILCKDRLVCLDY